MKASPIVAGLFSIGAASALTTTRATASLADCLGARNVPVQFASSPDYSELAEPFNLRLAYKPVAIVLPTTAQHVQDAVTCAVKSNVKVQAKSGGHSYASYSSGGQDGSMIIDLQPMQNITVDASGVAKVGGGVRLGNLAQGIYDQGKRALPHGTCPGVGIGGHFTHGGYGHTSRHWGVALDTIVALDVVLADGKLYHATSTSNADVFWALRGAADSFGVIVNFYLQTNAAPESVTYWSVQFDTMYSSEKTYVNSFLHIQDFARNSSVVDDRISFGIYEDGTGYSVGGLFFGTADEFNKKILPEFVRTLPKPKATVVQPYGWIPYLELVSDRNSIQEPLTGYDEHDDFFAKSITVPEKDGLSAASLSSKYKRIQKGAPTSWFVITNLYGGPGSKINNKDTNFAAYKDRDSLWVLQLYGNNPGSASIPFINDLTNAITSPAPNTDFGAYLNYVDPSLSPQTAHELYYGDDLYAKLLALKAKVDPQHVFYNPQAIGT